MRLKLPGPPFPAVQQFPGPLRDKRARCHFPRSAEVRPGNLHYRVGSDPEMHVLSKCRQLNLRNQSSITTKYGLTSPACVTIIFAMNFRHAAKVWGRIGAEIPGIRLALSRGPSLLFRCAADLSARPRAGCGKVWPANHAGKHPSVKPPLYPDRSKANKRPSRVGAQSTARNKAAEQNRRV